MVPAEMDQSADATSTAPALAGAAALWDAVRMARWLDRDRIIGYAAVLLVIELLTFLVMIAGTHGLIVPLGDRPTTTDFVSFYAAGRLADDGTPQLAYDQAAHYAAEERATAPGIGYQFFYYPPVYLLLCAAFAKLPYLAAFVLFEALSLLLYLAVARGILGETGMSALVPLAAFPAVFWTLGLGQNALLTAALFGAATLLVDRRPWVAGVLFGLLCYKPHFGLLVPIALAAGGHWRSIAAAAATVAALVAVSLLCFGWATWHDYLLTALTSRGTYENGRIDLAGMVSPFAGLRLAGLEPSLAYAGQAAVTAGTAFFVAVIWRCRPALPVRAAALLAATAVAVPVILIYDLMLVAIAMAWLVRAARQSDFLPWEKTVFAALFVAALATRRLGAAAHVPLALVVDLLMLGVIAARAKIMLAARHGSSPAL
jgi:alpha-1,2-mannosyltransferase